MTKMDLQRAETGSNGWGSPVVWAVGVGALVGLLAVLGSLSGAAGSLAGDSGLQTATGPQIALSASSGTTGYAIIVTGTHFHHSVDVNLTFTSPDLTGFNLNNQPYPYNHAITVTTNSTGGFVRNVNVPSVNRGSYLVIAREGPTTITSSFRVSSSSIHFSLSTTTVMADGCLRLTGHGFYPMDGENFYLGPWSNAAHVRILHGFSANVTGAFHRGWTVLPSLAPGTYVLVVVGSTYGTGVGAFTVVAGTGTPC